MKLLLIGLAASLFILGTTQSAKACSCVPKRSDDRRSEREIIIDAFKTYDVVFVGRVSKVVTTWSERKTTFIIERGFKGTKGTSIEISTDGDGSSCSFGFDRKKSYLVYAEWGETNWIEEGFKIGRWSIGTSMCGRTRLTADAKEDIDVLGEVTTAKPAN